MKQIIIRVNSYSNTAELRLDPEALSWLNDHLKAAFASQYGPATPLTKEGLEGLISTALDEGNDLALFIDDTRKAMIELIQYIQEVG